MSALCPHIQINGSDGVFLSWTFGLGWPWNSILLTLHLRSSWDYGIANVYLTLTIQYFEII
jgi:hypothetical protein